MGGAGLEGMNQNANLRRSPYCSRRALEYETPSPSGTKVWQRSRTTLRLRGCPLRRLLRRHDRLRHARPWGATERPGMDRDDLEDEKSGILQRLFDAVFGRSEATKKK
jgi:hypothetical protein